MLLWVGVSPVSGEYCKSCFSLVVVVAPGTKGFVSFAFLDARSVGLKLGQNMKMMCMREVWPSQRSREFKEEGSIKTLTA